jgi:hypothetical protein
MTAPSWGFPLRDEVVVAEDQALANIYVTLEMTEGCDHATNRAPGPIQNRKEDEYVL